MRSHVDIMMDITEEKQTDHSLQDTEERLRLAVESANIGTWDLNLATGETYWDRRCKAMFGLPSDADVSYERFLALVHPADRSRVIATIERSTDPSGDGLYDMEYRIVRPDRRDVWMRGIGRVFFEERDGKRQAIRFIGTALDIDESKQTQERLRLRSDELQQAVSLKILELAQSREQLWAMANELTLTEQRERRRLAANLHDYLAQLLVVMRMKLRQAVPLVPIEKATALLKDADQAVTQALEYTRSLVNELAPPTPNAFGFLQSVEWLVSEMLQRGLTVNVQSAAETLSLPDDQAILLFQSVRELLSNVLKHAHTDAVVVSLTITPNGALHVTVEDHGRGFDAATLDLQSARSARSGLSSLKERMATMGGRVSIHSAIGQGTKVTLTMPYWPVRPGDEHDEHSVPGAEASSQAHSLESATTQSHRDFKVQDSTLCEKPRVRVLLVDDHAIVRQGLRSVLESCPDIEVVGEAADGKESLVCIEQVWPSVIVMDLNMPRMNGIDATAIIKSRYPEIIVLGLSVNASEDNRTAMIQAGGSALLTKEAAVDQLYDLIHDTIATRQMV